MQESRLYSIRNRGAALIFCICAFIFNYYSCFPGFASPDTLDQYHQSISGVYNDWHPPVMALLWHYLNYIHKGPALMLFVQVAFLWLAAYVLLRHYNSKWWYISVIMLVLAPFVQNFAGYIIKDSQMALALFLAAALLLRMVSDRNRKPIWEATACILLLTYAGIVRPNAFPAVIPFCFLLAYVLFRTASGHKWIFAGLLLLIFIFACNMLQYKLVKDDQKQYPVDKLYMYDLTGIYKATGDNVYPAFLYNDPHFDTAYLRRKYIPASFDDIWWNADSVKVIPEGDDVTERQLRAYWFRAIKKHPGPYLANHLDGFLYYLRLKERKINFHYYFPYASAQLPDFNNKRAYDGELPFEGISFQSFMPYFTPWFWFLLNFVLLAFIPLMQRGFYRQYYIALCLSGILYQLPVFFIYQTDTDFRYFYWNCICCSLAIIVLLSFRRRQFKPTLKPNGATY